MSRRIGLCTAFLAGSLVLSAGGLTASGKKTAPKSDPGLAAAEQAARAEIAGPVDRREQLAAALEETADSAAVHWQAGFVHEGTVWRSFDAASANARDSTHHT